MQESSPDSGPTVLHTPQDGLVLQSEAETSASDWAVPAGLTLLVLCAVLYFGVRSRRSRGLPEERAFYSLAKRMGLHSRQMSAVRNYAKQAGIRSPIAVLMDQKLLSEAMKPRN